MLAPKARMRSGLVSALAVPDKQNNSAIAATALTQTRATPYPGEQRGPRRAFTRGSRRMNDRTGRDDAPANGWMVRLEDIHLKLASAAGEVNILRGLNLQVGTGETVSIVGP